MKTGVHIVLWGVVVLLVLLVVTHASGFSKATSAVGGQVTNDAYLLSGSASPGGSQAGHGTPPASWTQAA